MTRLTLVTLVMIFSLAAGGCNWSWPRAFCYRGAACNNCSSSTMTYPGSANYGSYEPGPMMPLPGPAASTIPSLPATPPPTN